MLRIALGTINPVKEIRKLAHEAGACYLDRRRAGSALIYPSMFRRLDCDFYCISSHKMYGPTGQEFYMERKKFLKRCLLIMVVVK